MKNVPNLRFKEFIAEWESKPLGELDVVLTRGPFGSALKKEIMVPKEDNTYKVYEQKHAIQKDSTIGEYYISELKYKELIRFSVSPGDFIMSCSGTIGEIFKIPQNSEKGVINQALLKFSVGNSINEDFFLYSFRKNLQSLETKGSGIKNITSVKFLKDEFIISFPKIEEQKKIASFFSLIDKKIELQTEKVEELKNYKKGIMQKIFSQQLRFKDENGNEYPEWEEKKLFEYTEKITTKNKDFTITNVISNSAKNGLISQRDFFDKDIANQNNIDGYYVIESGDLVYNPRKSIESPYGPINRYELQDTGVVSPLYLCFRINSELINGKFLAYYFKSSAWHKFIYKNSDQGVRHDRVSIKDAEFFNMNIGIPLIEEQSKVVKFLDCLEDKLKQEQTKLDYLIEYKKGLLQQMFI